MPYTKKFVTSLTLVIFTVFLLPTEFILAKSVPIPTTSAPSSDLVIQKANIIRHKSSKKTPYRLAITIANKGNKKAPRFQIIASDTSSSWNRRINVPYLNPRQVRTMYIPIANLFGIQKRIKTQTFRIILDPKNQIAETNETNNAYIAGLAGGRSESAGSGSPMPAKLNGSSASTAGYSKNIPPATVNTFSGSSTMRGGSSTSNSSRSPDVIRSLTSSGGGAGNSSSGNTGGSNGGGSSSSSTISSSSSVSGGSSNAENQSTGSGSNSSSSNSGSSNGGHSNQSTGSGSSSNPISTVGSSSATPDPEPSKLILSPAPAPETPTYLEIPQGTENVLFSTAYFQTEQKNVLVKTLTVSGFTDSNAFHVSDYISSVKLESDRHGTIGTISNFNGKAVFSNLFLYLPANSLTKFKIYATAKRGASHYPMKVRLSFENALSVEAYNYDNVFTPTTIASSHYPFASSNWNDIVESGSIMLDATNQPSDQIVSPGQLNVPVLTFSLSAGLEEFRVQELTFFIAGPNINISKASLFDDQGVLYGYYDNFSSIGPFSIKPSSLVIKAGLKKNFILKADINGDAVEHSINKFFLRNIIALGVTSQTTKTLHANVIGNSITIKLTDLIMEDIFFDSQSILNLKVKNIGDIKMPEINVNFGLEIDGIYRDMFYLLNSEGNPKYLLPGESLIIPTNYRLTGENRVIKTTIDSLNVLREGNERNNIREVILTPPFQSGPDFIITDITRGPSDELAIILKNVGNSASKDKLELEYQVTSALTYRGRSEDYSYNDFTIELPSIGVGEYYLLTPSPSLIFNRETKVEVQFITGSILDEIDNTNNSFEDVIEQADLVTRAELARLIAVTNSMPVITSGGPHFSDVPTVHPDYSYIETLFANGSMTPFSDGSFKPDLLVNRGEVSQVSKNYYDLPTDTSNGPHYKDVQSMSPYYEAIETIFHYLGYSNNQSYTLFYPEVISDTNFAFMTIDIMERIAKNLQVTLSDSNPSNQTIQPGQQNVNLMNIDVLPLRHPVILTNIQIVITDKDNHQYGEDIANILDSLTVKQDNIVIAQMTPQKGYIDFNTLKFPIPTGQTMKFSIIGNFSKTAPAGASIQLQIRKNNLYSPHGIITQDSHKDYHVNNIMNYPDFIHFKTYTYMGPVVDVGEN